MHFSRSEQRGLCTFGREDWFPADCHLFISSLPSSALRCLACSFLGSSPILFSTCVFSSQNLCFPLIFPSHANISGLLIVAVYSKQSKSFKRCPVSPEKAISWSLCPLPFPSTLRWVLWLFTRFSTIRSIFLALLCSEKLYFLIFTTTLQNTKKL